MRKMMAKAVVMVMVTMAMFLAPAVPAQAKNHPQYEMLTVQSVHEMWSPVGKEEPIWYIEYQGDILMYSGVEYPMDTEIVLADVSGDVPDIVNPIELFSDVFQNHE